MAEYWKSTPKYWCKHCSIYVKDTKFERQQHEATGKHQGNLKRFLRGVHQEREKEEREKQRAKAEVDRLRGLVGATPPTVTKASASTAIKDRSSAPTSQATAADRKKQMAQLAEMGIAVPENFRGELALAGEWQTIAQQPVDEAARSQAEQLNVGVRKRKLGEGVDEDEEASSVQLAARKGWGSTTKTYSGVSSSVSPDLESLLSGNILPKKETSAQDSTGIKVEPKSQDETVDQSAENDTKAAVKKEPDAPEAVEGTSSHTDEASAPAGVFFKKRKPKSVKQG